MERAHGDCEGAGVRNGPDGHAEHDDEDDDDNNDDNNPSKNVDINIHVSIKMFRMLKFLFSSC